MFFYLGKKSGETVDGKKVFAHLFPARIKHSCCCCYHDSYFGQLVRNPGMPYDSPDSNKVAQWPQCGLLLLRLIHGHADEVDQDFGTARHLLQRQADRGRQVICIKS